jgi:fumarate hydratase class I
MPRLEKQLFELIARAATDLPADVETALQKAWQNEPEGTSCHLALDTILDNVRLAREKHQPICQDTGTIHFFVKAAADLTQESFQQSAEKAIVKATELGLLRQNCVETLSGKNTANNLGYLNPTIHWKNSSCGKSLVTVMLKGGGCENMGCQYSLPDERLEAGRDLEGVRRCVLDAAWNIQGHGCAPGILGVAIGGDRAGGHEESKLQLLRKIGQRSPEPVLAALEERLLRECNQLGIGTMGFGGKTTVLEVFLETRCRLPASYFVSIAYMCWCCRRQNTTIE